MVATHPDGQVSCESVKRYVAYGSSPRGLQALVRGARAYCLLSKRTAVSVSDIQRASKPSLRHRLILNFEGEAEGVDVDRIVEEVVASVPKPSEN